MDLIVVIFVIIPTAMLAGWAIRRKAHDMYTKRVRARREAEARRMRVYTARSKKAHQEKVWRQILEL